MQPSERLRKSLTVDNLWQYIIKVLGKPRYAYEITKLLMPLDANMITVYSVLYRLETGGYIKKTFSRKGGGPERKYYVATTKGLDELKAAKKILLKHAKDLNA
ncbi:MAG: helix-turn-helix transcriptional regulator [Candidatus Aenigmarchaeota archaeon]|nr:helix-turn-helix transcriptional regulator [Candidatus Aenigmarchaeota archaeon]